MDKDGKVLYLWLMPTKALIRLFRQPQVRLNTPPAFHRHEGARPWAPPPLPDYDLFFVLEGMADLELNGRRQIVTPNTAIVFRPGAQLACRPDPHNPYRNFAVHFEFRTSGMLDLPPQGQQVRNAAFFALLARQCETAWRTGGELGRQQAAWFVTQMLLHLWLEAQSPSAPITDSRIVPTIEAVLEEPGRHWSVSTLAKQAGLSRSQFARHLTVATGMSPEQFLIHARIDRAKHLLRETDMTISQIADALGYRDVFYFSRQFARVAGKTATSHRK